MVDKRREVRGTNWRVRESVRLHDCAEPRDLTTLPESHRDYLQRLAEMLFKPKRQDGSA